MFDGLWHAFLVNPELPESSEAYALISRFFAQHLRRNGSRVSQPSLAEHSDRAHDLALHGDARRPVEQSAVYKQAG